MKKLFTILSVLFLSMSAIASRLNAFDTIRHDTSKTQINEYRHELSMGMSNLSDRFFPYLFWDYYYTSSAFTDYYFLSNDNMAMPTYGISYKYHFNKCAFRAGLDFNTDNNTFRQTSSSSPSYSANSTHLSVSRFGARVGMERKKNLGKSQMFAGSDLFFESFTSKFITSSEDYSFFRSSVGISPLIGVRYSLSKLISFSAETKLNIAYNSQTINDTNIGASSSSSSTYKGSGMSVKINPISQLAINIHF